MSQLTPLISDLALILICAGIMTLIFKKLKQPLVLGILLPALSVPHILSLLLRLLILPVFISGRRLV